MTTPETTPSAALATFSPAPGAARLPKMVAAQARMESILMLRNGEQLLLAVVVPLIVLVGGIEGVRHLALATNRPAVDILAPGVLALAVMSTSFTSLAIATGFERRYGVLKRLGSSPLSRTGLLAGKVGALLMVEVLQIIVLSVVAALLGWAPSVAATGILGGLVTVLLGTAAFASLGLFLAGALRAEATLAAANLVYLVLLAGGAVVLPTSSYGGFGSFLAFLPSGALGTGLREALTHGGFPAGPVLVLLGWTVLGTALTARTFSWE